MKTILFALFLLSNVCSVLSARILTADAQQPFLNTFNNITDATTLTPDQLAQFGNDLINNYYATISNQSAFQQNKNSLLSPAFQIVRSDGERFSKEDFVPVNFTQVNLTDVRVTAPSSDIIVLRFNNTLTDSSSTAATFSNEKSPRLDVFMRNNKTGQWQIASLANFNPVVSYNCNSPQVEALPPAVENSQEATKTNDLAEILLKNIFDHFSNGTGVDILDPQAQGQFSNGLGYTTSSEYKPGRINQTEISDVEALRYGNIMVASYNVQNAGTVYSTVAFSNITAPRLTVFKYNPDTKDWKVISHAIFNPTAKLVDGCNGAAAAAPGAAPVSGSSVVGLSVMALMASVAMNALF